VPEGDTVWLAGRRLHQTLAGQRLTATDFRVPQLATTDLSGREVREVASRGKHLLIRIEPDLTLHTHFLMDGEWHLYRHGTRWRGGPAWQVRVVLATAGWDAVGYRLPVVDLLPTAEEDRVVGHLGPDLLGPDWDVAEAVRRLTAQPERPIGEALLDQRNLAGIGNLYKAEVLFLSGVHPWAPVGEVADLPGMVELARRLLLLNRDRPAQVTTGDPRRGRQHWVYDRDGKPCRRCGTPLARGMQGEPPRSRAAYWCPSCQPASHPR
jgi:endonuclease VIII